MKKRKTEMQAICMLCKTVEECTLPVIKVANRPFLGPMAERLL